MITNFYFVRHGEVENSRGIWYGRLDGYPLSNNGKIQADLTADYLKTQYINELYSSPLLRSKQTAEIIALKLNLDIHYSNDLLEINSIYQGKKYSELSMMDYDIFSSSTNTIEAESMDHVVHRINNFLQETSKNKQNITVVTHGDVIMMLKLLIQGLELNNNNLRKQTGTYVQNCEVWKLSYENGTIKSLQSVFKPSS